MKKMEKDQCCMQITHWWGGGWVTGRREGYHSSLGGDFGGVSRGPHTTLQQYRNNKLIMKLSNVYEPEN